MLFGKYHIMMIGILASSIVLAVNIFLLIKLDATNRGMPNPWIWALVMAGNSSGLIIYLLLREPGVLELDTATENKYKKYKNLAKISLLVLYFIVIIVMYKEFFVY